MKRISMLALVGGLAWLTAGATVGRSAERLVPRPHLDLSATYDDNVFISPSNKTNDLYFTISPGLRLEYGDPKRNWLAVDYTASIVRFMDLTSENTVNHTATFDAHVRFNKLSVAVTHVLQDVTGANVEVGDRIEQMQNVTDVSLEYQVSSKTSLGVNYHQQFREFDSPTQIDNQQYEAGAAFYYRLFSKTDVFGQFNYGWVNVETGNGDARYQEVNLGVRTTPASKIVGTAKAGYQHRDFENAIGSINSIVASVSLVDNFTDRTSVELIVSRSINPSVTSPGNAYTATRAGLSLRQKLWNRKILFSAGGAYEHDEFDQPVLGVDRSDDYWEASLGLDCDVTKWLQVGAAYRHRRNGSTLHSVSFDGNIATVHALVRF